MRQAGPVLAAAAAPSITPPAARLPPHADQSISVDQILGTIAAAATAARLSLPSPHTTRPRPRRPGGHGAGMPCNPCRNTRAPATPAAVRHRRPPVPAPRVWSRRRGSLAACPPPTRCGCPRGKLAAEEEGPSFDHHHQQHHRSINQIERAPSPCFLPLRPPSRCHGPLSHSRPMVFD